MKTDQKCPNKCSDPMELIDGLYTCFECGASFCKQSDGSFKQMTELDLDKHYMKDLAI